VATRERAFVFWFRLVKVSHMLCCLRILDFLVTLTAFERKTIQFFHNETIDIFTFFILRVAMGAILTL
jgi:hypothetical protein